MIAQTPAIPASNPEAATDSPPMPVRRLHNFAYCPRLFYFQWVENLFEENADTVAGSALHRNADRPSHWQEQLDLTERARIRSLELESETLGLRGVIDLVEDDGSGAGPEIIDYKKGAPRRDENGSRVPKTPDAVQVAAYALLMREHGFEPARASIYYASERLRLGTQTHPGRAGSGAFPANPQTPEAGACRRPSRETAAALA